MLFADILLVQLEVQPVDFEHVCYMFNSHVKNLSESFDVFKKEKVTKKGSFNLLCTFIHIYSFIPLKHGFENAT